MLNLKIENKIDFYIFYEILIKIAKIKKNGKTNNIFDDFYDFLYDIFYNYIYSKC